MGVPPPPCPKWHGGDPSTKPHAVRPAKQAKGLDRGQVHVRAGRTPGQRASLSPKSNSWGESDGGEATVCLPTPEVKKKVPGKPEPLISLDCGCGLRAANAPSQSAGTAKRLPKKTLV